MLVNIQFSIVEPPTNGDTVLDGLSWVRMGLDVTSAGSKVEVERVKESTEGRLGKLYKV